MTQIPHPVPILRGQIVRATQDILRPWPKQWFNPEGFRTVDIKTGEEFEVTSNLPCDVFMVNRGKGRMYFKAGKAPFEIVERRSA